MSDELDVFGENDPVPVEGPVAMPRVPDEPMPPIRNRFLFVDVAAQRAKQLRRGALPRLEGLRPNPETGERPEVQNRLERVAMEEVGCGLVLYELPEDDADEAKS